MRYRLLHMRPKARGLVQHGGPSAGLRDIDPAGVILYVMDRPYRLPFHYCPGCPTGAARMQADGISSCCYIVNVYITTIRLPFPYQNRLPCQELPSSELMQFPAAVM
jgi:hypothetical protein